MLALEYSDHIGGANVTNVTRSITVPSVTRGILIVLVMAEDTDAGYHTNDPVVTGITFGGVALTKLTSGKGDNGSSSGSCELWYLLNPTPSTANVVVSRTGEVNGSDVCSLVFSGVDQTTPFNVNGNATGTTETTWTKQLTSTVNNCIMVGGLGATTGTLTGPDAGQTSVFADSTNGFSKGVSYKSMAAAGAFSLTWTGNAARWGIAAGALNPHVDATGLPGPIGCGIVPTP